MNFHKSALVSAVALACSHAHALEEVPVNLGLAEAAPAAVAHVTAQAVPQEFTNIEVGHASAGFGLDPVLRKAFVTNYNSGTLSVIDVDSGEVVTIDVGPNPRRMSYNAALRRAYILNDTTPGAVTVFDADEGRVLTRIAVGKRPRTIDADFQRGEVYVANLDSDTMSIISTASNEVTTTVSVGSQPFIGGVDGTRGLVYVVSQVDRVVHVLDAETKQVVATVATGRLPGGATIEESTGKVYLNNTADQSITVIDPVKKAVKVVYGTGTGSTFGTVSTVFKRYYLPNATDYTITILDTDTDEIVKTVPVGASPQQITQDSGDGDIYVVNRLSNSVTILDQRTEKVIASLPSGINPWRVYLGLQKVFVLNENGNSFDSVTLAPQANTLAGTALAVEWYHAGFDHYFHSAGGIENRLIGDGTFGNTWNRTFDVFRVWTEDGPARVGVCRFFNESFGERSSHAYVPAGAECEGLKAGDVWKFEEIAYFIELPDAAGTCRDGTTPIYRAYNNGMGGAPNHIITGNKAKRDMLVKAGWVAEGSGTDAIAACGPSVRGDEL